MFCWGAAAVELRYSGPGEQRGGAGGLTTLTMTWLVLSKPSAFLAAASWSGVACEVWVGVTEAGVGAAVGMAGRAEQATVTAEGRQGRRSGQ